MSWETVLKAKKRNKVNMEHLRKIVDHLLPNMEDEFSLDDFNKMVATTYLRYNPTNRAINLKSILGQMLRNRGYTPFQHYQRGFSYVHYRKL